MKKHLRCVPVFLLLSFALMAFAPVALAAFPGAGMYLGLKAENIKLAQSETDAVRDFALMAQSEYCRVFLDVGHSAYDEYDPSKGGTITDPFDRTTHPTMRAIMEAVNINIFHYLGSVIGGWITTNPANFPIMQQRCSISSSTTLMATAGVTMAIPPSP